MAVMSGSFDVDAFGPGGGQLPRNREVSALEMLARMGGTAGKPVAIPCRHA